MATLVCDAAIVLLKEAWPGLVLLAPIVDIVFAMERGRSPAGAMSAVGCLVDVSRGGTAPSLSVCEGSPAVIVAEVLTLARVWLAILGSCGAMYIKL